MDETFDKERGCMVPKGSISKVYEYFFTTPRYRGEVLRAMRIFFNRPDLAPGGALALDPEKSEGLFNEWFLYDFTLKNDLTPLEEFIAKNPLTLDASAMQLYRDLRKNTYGFYEVLTVKRGQSLTLKDLQTGKKWVVREKKATYESEIGTCFFARVAKVGDHREIVGADSFSFPGIDRALRRFFRDQQYRITPKEVHAVFCTGEQF